MLLHYFCGCGGQGFIDWRGFNLFVFGVHGFGTRSDLHELFVGEFCYVCVVMFVGGVADFDVRRNLVETDLEEFDLLV